MMRFRYLGDSIPWVAVVLSVAFLSSNCGENPVRSDVTLTIQTSADDNREDGLVRWDVREHPEFTFTAVLAGADPDNYMFAWSQENAGFDLSDADCNRLSLHVTDPACGGGGFAFRVSVSAAGPGPDVLTAAIDVELLPFLCDQ